MTPEELIAEQDATITELRAEIDEMSREIDSLNDELSDAENMIDRLEKDHVEAGPITLALGRYLFAELGTASPSPLDLEGRPELVQLWEAVR